MRKNAEFIVTGDPNPCHSDHYSLEGIHLLNVSEEFSNVKMKQMLHYSVLRV